MAAYDHIDFAPPQAARDAAKRALEIRAEKPESQRGMTPVGIARARDLANGRRLSPDTVRRMLAYFTRHEIDKRGETWDEQGPGWQAWQGWGGDAGFAWARKIVRQLDAADRARGMADAPQVPDLSAAVVLPLDDEVAEYIALPGATARSPAHVVLCVVTDVVGVANLAPMLRAVVAEWAQGTPALPASLSGVARLSGAEDGPDALSLVVDAIGLSAAREGLVQQLRAAGFDPSTGRGFAPHATLDYLPREAPTPALPYDLPLATVLDRVAVWIGDDRGEAMPLAGVTSPFALSGDEGEGDPREAVDGVRGATESITCRDAARVGSKTWNQIARFGTFRAHPQGGFAFGPEQFAQIVRNFRATKNRAVPVDYEHASERHPENVGQKGVPALAWIVDLEDRGPDGLWALFDWKDPDAVEHVRAERYRYLSPAVNFAARDKETGQPIGARLTSCALTNQPFLDGMAPVTASEHAPSEGPSLAVDTDAGDAAVRLSLAPGDVHVPTTALPVRDHMTTAADHPPPPPPEKDPKDKELAELKDKHARAMADAEDYGVKLNEMTAKLAAMRGRLCAMAGVEDAEGAEDIAIEKLQAIVNDLRASQKAEAEELAKKAATAHGLSDAPASIERLTSMVLSDRAGFEAMFPKAIAPAVVDTTLRPSATAPSATTQTLLGTRVAGDPVPPAPVTMSDRATPAAISAQRAARAEALLRDGTAKSQTEALLMADRELSRVAVAPFLR